VPLLVSGVRWLDERDQSLNTEHTFGCGSAPMGKIEGSINPNAVKTIESRATATNCEHGGFANPPCL